MVTILVVNNYKGVCIKMKALDTLALILVIVGALNWGLIGFFNFDLVASLFGTMSAFSRIIYAVVGICGLYAISFFAKDRYESID